MSEALPFFEGEYQLWWQLPRGLGFQLGAWMFCFFLHWSHVGHHVRLRPWTPSDWTRFAGPKCFHWSFPWVGRVEKKLGQDSLASVLPMAFRQLFERPSLTEQHAQDAQERPKKSGVFTFSWSIWIQESLLSLSWHVMSCDVGSSSCSICWNSGGSTFNRVFSLCSSSYNSYSSRSVKARTAWRVKGLGRWCRSGFQAAWGLNGVGWHGVAPCKGDSFIALGPLISGTCNFFESPKFPWA